MSKTLHNQTAAEYQRIRRIAAREIPQLSDMALEAVLDLLIGRRICKAPCYMCDPRDRQYAAQCRKRDYDAEL